ncbi:MAG: ankyrin repeat domain-containing protein [Ktedonobacterales bacterium]
MNTPRVITYAALTGDVPALRELLDTNPILVHSYSYDGWTPLHLAAYGGHQEAVSVLLNYGAHVDVRAHNGLGSTPLLRAVIGQQMDVVELLIAHGADINATDTSGSTPLHKAALLGNTTLVQCLLDHGADMCATNSGGQTPLAHALFNRHADVATLLQPSRGARAEVQPG